MFKDAYSKEIFAMKAISSTRTFIGNLNYKLKNDKNVTVYLQQITSRAANIDNLSHREKLDFKQETKAITPVLNRFIGLIIEYADKNNLTASQISTRCNVFPDSTGESILQFVGHYQLVKMISEIFQYETMFYEEECSKEITTFQLKQQKKQLNPTSFMYSHFIDNQNYIDNEAKLKKYELEKDFFENTRKPQLINLINALLEQFELSKLDQSAFFLVAGIKSLDIEIESRKNHMKKTTETFSAIINSLIANPKQK